MMEAGQGQDGALMFVGAAFLMAAAMALDGLDGNLARATGQVTRWGDYLDHTLDRALDVVWILADEQMLSNDLATGERREARHTRVFSREA